VIHRALCFGNKETGLMNQTPAFRATVLCSLAYRSSSKTRLWFEALSNKCQPYHFSGRLVVAGTQRSERSIGDVKTPDRIDQ
jgi:hypothetical protein